MLVFLFINFANSIQFGYEAEKGQQICFLENFSQDDAFDLKIRGNSTQYALKVQESQKKIFDILYEKNGQWEHYFQHQSSHQASQLRYCLTNLDNDVIAYSITYKTGIELADLQRVAKISDLNEMGVQLDKLNQTMSDIKRERSFLISKYEMMSQIQGSISKKQMAFGLLCLGLSLIITVITVNMIKRILRQKKVM